MLGRNPHKMRHWGNWQRIVSFYVKFPRDEDGKVDLKNAGTYLNGEKSTLKVKYEKEV
jgi:hypothetical protein